MARDDDFPLLNVFDVETDEGVRRLIGFVDPVRAGAEGIANRKIVGAFTPDAEGRFDPSAFSVNAEFLAAFTDFMNDEPSRSPEVAGMALKVPSDWLYILDPRDDSPDDADPPASDVVGCYAVDETGQIVPNSFQYNREHRWFCPARGTSGLLDDRRFYDWVNR